LLKFRSPLKRIFIDSHSLSPSGRLIGHSVRQMVVPTKAFSLDSHAARAPPRNGSAAQSSLPADATPSFSPKLPHPPPTCKILVMPKGSLSPLFPAYWSEHRNCNLRFSWDSTMPRRHGTGGRTGPISPRLLLQHQFSCAAPQTKMA
jgi:hypothetical protein